MGKSLRSSRLKTNKSHLRARVHKPVEDARTERLHAKLLEIAQKPKEEMKVNDEVMVDGEPTERDQIEASLDNSEEKTERMEIDDEAKKNPGSTSKRKSNKISKKRKGKDKTIFRVGKEHRKPSSRKGPKGPGIR